MSHELICAWLKIPPHPWPPDHYTLVGLPPGEADAARIEQHVHERHECLLRYQLTHPELVTEALNRLAQAFVTLTDPAAKKVYDAALFPERKPVAPIPAPAPPPEKPAAPGADPLAWLYGPFTQNAKDTVLSPAPETPANGSPVQPPAPAASPVPAPVPAAPATAAAPPPEVKAPEKGFLVEEPVDPVVAVARSPIARRGLGTKGALYHRIARTRQLLRAWVQVGKYVGDANYRLTARPDAVDLHRQLSAIREYLQGFPPLLGQAGQPGYLVVALARQQKIVQIFLELLPSQREALVRDWQAGLTLLAAHRMVLREEIWALRRKSRIGRAFYAVRGLLTEHPAVWLLLLAIVAVNVVLAPPPLIWALEVGSVVVALFLFILIRGLLPGRRWLDRTRGPAGPRRQRTRTVR